MNKEEQRNMVRNGRENMSKVKEIEEVLLGENSDGLQCADRLTKCKDSVCYLNLVDEDNIRHGTGSFVKVTIRGMLYKCIITNHHVIPDKQIADGGVARFFYEGSNPGIHIELKPDLLFATHVVLDYTLVGCDWERIEEHGIAALEFSDKTGNVGDSIFIFQHPKGESKKVSYQQISKIVPPFLYYKADTDIGSSGSPVLSKFQPIAIHSKGCDREHYNKGTLCSEILQHLNFGTYSQPKPVEESAMRERKREALTNGLDNNRGRKKPKIDFPCKDPDQQPTEEELQCLACDIISSWKPIGRKLGVPNNDIMKIHKDHINYDDIIEKAFAMLLAWKEKQGTLANYGRLKDVLISCGLVCTAQRHC